MLRRADPCWLTASVSSASVIASARSMERRTRRAMASSCSLECPGLASVTSMAVRITVSGVRSSCEASATKRRCAVNARSSRSSISSKVSASSFSSSRAPASPIRSPRCWSEARRAVSVIIATGRSTRPDTIQPAAAEATVSSARPRPENNSRLCSVRRRWATAAARLPAR